MTELGSSTAEVGEIRASISNKIPHNRLDRLLIMEDELVAALPLLFAGCRKKISFMMRQIIPENIDLYCRNYVP